LNEVSFLATLIDLIKRARPGYPATTQYLVLNLVLCLRHDGLEGQRPCGRLEDEFNRWGVLSLMVKGSPPLPWLVDARALKSGHPLAHLYRTS
jgi:hypothetical protein